jgi:hypothetical protein
VFLRLTISRGTHSLGLGMNVFSILGYPGVKKHLNTCFLCDTIIVFFLNIIGRVMTFFMFVDLCIFNFFLDCSHFIVIRARSMYSLQLFSLFNLHISNRIFREREIESVYLFLCSWSSCFSQKLSPNFALFYYEIKDVKGIE